MHMVGSSSTDAWRGAVADIVSVPQSAMSALVPVRDASHVKVCFNPHLKRWFIMSTITMEVKPLPTTSAPPWMMDFDDDGDVFVTTVDAEQVLLASDVLLSTVLADSSGPQRYANELHQISSR